MLSTLERFGNLCHGKGHSVPGRKDNQGGFCSRKCRQIGRPSQRRMLKHNTVGVTGIISKSGE